MPRAVAPPPSGEFQVKLSKPFAGEPKLTIEVLGEPNRSAVIRQTHYTGNNKSSEKTGDVSSDDVNELMKLVQELRGFPSSASKDIYGADVKVDFNTFDIQWSNDEEEASEGDVEKEQKDDFKRIADSIEALARQFATNDSAI
ncbi:uncharacterized protein SEPMUDRAFT_146863 [Sphaerulina musiva SO2202]|uniref:Uncharacterized protein n=1 Tax=Sphaerulina musiva (strain SO2202) TaxID=692275 RepID=N1QL30_SPHMS|nr:uncharacterized protein SEPMUDRAFT_146863 [Sphaerulina musiva SO2202]EMF17971.1 hypothetical protein SEPMUDRAFT_146863 [Sphaerulina musiva SO2202]